MESIWYDMDVSSEKWKYHSMAVEGAKRPLKQTSESQGKGKGPEKGTLLSRH